MGPLRVVFGISVLLVVWSAAGAPGLRVAAFAAGVAMASVAAFFFSFSRREDDADEPLPDSHATQQERSLQRQLAERCRSEQRLEDDKRRAESASRAKSRFLATMSHEMRTPINGIVGTTTLLQKTELDTDQRRYARTIERCSESLLALVDDTLDLAKIEAGRMQLRSEPFRLADEVAKVVDVVEEAARQKGLTLETRLAGDLPAGLRGDATRIRQVLLNLVGNAVKFADEGGVVVAVRRDAEAFRFSVRDTGPGIDAAEASRIFNAFSQTDSAMRGARGSGLGLAICKQLVALMDGEIGVDSAPGEGSEFWFRLRLAVAAPEELPPAGASARQAVRERPAGVAPTDGATLRVLLVEDNDMNRELVVDILDLEGIVCDEAVNGHEALDLLARYGDSRYAVVLMDCQMPIMDGYRATAEIRKRLERHLPVIALTANALDTDRARCLDAGMDDYISKPFHPDTLLQCVRRWAAGDADAGDAEEPAFRARDFLDRHPSAGGPHRLRRLAAELERSLDRLRELIEARTLEDADRQLEAIREAADQLQTPALTRGLDALARSVDGEPQEQLDRLAELESLSRDISSQATALD